MSSARSPASGPVAGLIVAGGASERFGRDKARHRVEGTPMIARVYRALDAVAAPVVVSVGTTGASYADVLPDGAAHVRDKRAGAGPLAGLEAGFRALGASWVLVAACDMPHVTPDGFRLLLNARDDATDAIVGRSDDGRWHPLFACYQRERTLDAIQRSLSEGDFALHALLDRLTVRAASIPSRVVHNVNRPEDLGES